MEWGNLLLQHCLHPGFRFRDNPSKLVIGFTCDCSEASALQGGAYISLKSLKRYPIEVNQLVTILKEYHHDWREKYKIQLQEINRKLRWKKLTPSRRRKLRRLRAQIYKTVGIGWSKRQVAPPGVILMDNGKLVNEV